MTWIHDIWDKCTSYDTWSPRTILIIFYVLYAISAYIGILLWLWDAEYIAYTLWQTCISVRTLLAGAWLFRVYPKIAPPDRAMITKAIRCVFIDASPAIYISYMLEGTLYYGFQVGISICVYALLVLVLNRYAEGRPHIRLEQNNSTV